MLLESQNIPLRLHRVTDWWWSSNPMVTAGKKKKKTWKEGSFPWKFVILQEKTRKYNGEICLFGRIFCTDCRAINIFPGLLMNLKQEKLQNGVISCCKFSHFMNPNYKVFDKTTLLHLQSSNSFRQASSLTYTINCPTFVTLHRQRMRVKMCNKWTPQPDYSVMTS